MWKFPRRSWNPTPNHTDRRRSRPFSKEVRPGVKTKTRVTLRTSPGTRVPQTPQTDTHKRVCTHSRVHTVSGTFRRVGRLTQSTGDLNPTGGPKYLDGVGVVSVVGPFQGIGDPLTPGCSRRQGTTGRVRSGHRRVRHRPREG